MNLLRDTDRMARRQFDDHSRKRICPLSILMILGLFLITVQCFASDAESRTDKKATLYEIGSQKTIVLFRWVLVVDREDRQSSKFYTPDGNLSAEDEIIWKDGQFKSYHYRRLNIKEDAEVTRQKDQLVFTQKWKGKTRSRKEPFPSNFVIGPMVVSYIREHWAALRRGKKFFIRYGVPDHLRTLGFNLKCDPNAQTSEQNPVVVKMEASSFLIRFFLNPIYFKFSPDGQILYSITGRTLPVTVEGDGSKPVDAEMVFHH